MINFGGAITGVDAPDSSFTRIEPGVRINGEGYDPASLVYSSFDSLHDLIISQTELVHLNLITWSKEVTAIMNCNP